MVSREEVAKRISEKKIDIPSDNPQVEMTKLKLDAIVKLADHNNDVFSQLTKDRMQDETFDYALAITFATNPLRPLEERLRARGIKEKFVSVDKEGNVIKDSEGKIVYEERDVVIKVDLFQHFLKEFLIRRHSLNRKRVEEYIDALDKASGNEIPTARPQQPTVLGRFG